MISSQLVRRITPRASDYFVIKPQVSGFYATNLPVVLPRLGVSRLVMVGVAADICILFTAAGRAYAGVWALGASRRRASENDERKGWALDILSKTMDAETRPTTALTLTSWSQSN